MDPRRREALRRATGEAAAAVRREVEAGREKGARQRPGDLVVLPATAEHAVEWLLAERDGGRWLLVPADVDPWVGSADLEVAAEETGGPLVLRCRHALWADAAVLADAVASGRLEARRAAAAAERHRRAADGSLDGSPLERETDADPVYRRRDGEVAAARAVVAGAALAGEQRRQAGRFGGSIGTVPLWRAAAAVLLVALAGVVWWGVGLRQEVAELSAPEVLTFDDSVEWSATRGDGVEVVTDTRNRFLALDLIWGEITASVARIQVVDATGQTVWESEPIGLDRRRILRLPWSVVPPGSYRLRLVTATEPTGELATVELRVEPPV